MTVIEILIILVIVALAYVAIKWVLALMGHPVPDVILVLGCILVLLLVLSGQCRPEIGIGGR